MVHMVKRSRSVIAATALMSQTLWAQTPDAASSHFAPDEDVNASFSWEPGAECTLSDHIGVVLRSNWQDRHWIKIAGEQIEFNGNTEMSDAGWYQTFVGDNFTVILRLKRLLPEPEGSDGVRFAGVIVVTQSAQSSEYQVTGACGA